MAVRMQYQDNYIHSFMAELRFRNHTLLRMVYIRAVAQGHVLYDIEDAGDGRRTRFVRMKEDTFRNRYGEFL